MSGMADRHPWMADAACKGMAAEFHASGRAARYAARAICLACPVLEECRTWALRRPDPCRYGVAGGLLPEERQRLTRDPARRRRATLAGEASMEAGHGGS